VDTLVAAAGEGSTVAVLGLAFKPDTDDLRGSPALEIIEQLRTAGVHVRAHDPVAMTRAAREVPQLDLRADAYATVDGADAVLLATEWPEYVALDWARVRSLMRGATLLDGRNVLDGPRLRQLGFVYHSFGRGGYIADSRVLDLTRLAELEEGAYLQHAPESFTPAREPVADPAA
jgi:UDPglucose 6-dehydrogenase